MICTKEVEMSSLYPPYLTMKCFDRPWCPADWTGFCSICCVFAHRKVSRLLNNGIVPGERKNWGQKRPKTADRITAAAAIHARHTRAHNDSTLRYCSWQLGMIYLFHNLVFIIRFINNLYQSVALPNNVSLEIPDWDGWKTYPTKIEKK